MADKKISELTELDLGADDDLLAIEDTSASETKYIQKDQFLTNYEYQSIFASEFLDGITSPDNLEIISSGTSNKIEIREFSGSGTSDVVAPFEVPFDFSGSSICYRVIGFISQVTAPTAKGISFKMSGYSLGDNDNIDGAECSEVESNVTGTYSQYDRFITGWSTGVQVTGVTAGETTLFKFNRDHDDASDTYEEKVGVYSIQLRYMVEKTNV